MDQTKNDPINYDNWLNLIHNACTETEKVQMLRELVREVRREARNQAQAAVMEVHRKLDGILL